MTEQRHVEFVFPEMNISGKSTDTMMLAISSGPNGPRPDPDGCIPGVALALLDPEAHCWVVYDTDLEGVKAIRESCDKLIGLLENWGK